MFESCRPLLTYQNEASEHAYLAYTNSKENAMPEKKLTKFDALRILGNAYWYAMEHVGYGYTVEILEDKFGRVRRSLSVRDMAPQHDTEGLNGRMPTHF